MFHNSFLKDWIVFACPAASLCFFWFDGLLVSLLSLVCCEDDPQLLAVSYHAFLLA